MEDLLVNWVGRRCPAVIMHTFILVIVILTFTALAAAAQ